MGFFNTGKAYIDGQGNLTMGYELNDPNYDTTHKYAKGDVFVNVPLSNVLYAAGDTAAFTSPIAANTIARVTGAAGTGFSGLNVARNVLGNFLIPLRPPFFRTLSAANDAQGRSQSVPHGSKLRAVNIAYKVYNTNLTAAPTIALFTQAFPTDGAARPANSAITHTYTVGGVVTTAANLPKTAHATNVNVVRAVVTTPAFVTTLGTEVFAEFQAQTANTAASDICELVAVCAEWSVALY